MASFTFKIFAILLFCMLVHDVLGHNNDSHNHNKVIVDCLNRPDNTGKFLIKVYFANMTQGWRSKELIGACTPGSFVNFYVDELVGYVWIKAQSLKRAYFKIATQQPINGVYTRQSWSYEGKSAFITTSGHIEVVPALTGFPSFIRCDSCGGVNGDGMCELSGSAKQPLSKIIPYKSTVHDIALGPKASYTEFLGLTNVGITQGGSLGRYWDFRSNSWVSDDCYTFTANFSDGHSFEVTCPTRDFASLHEARTKSSEILVVVGQVPKYIRDWIKTIAVNGGGPGSRAGTNLTRMSFNLNLGSWIQPIAYKLFLHEGSHEGLHFLEHNQKWKMAKDMDPAYISKHSEPHHDHDHDDHDDGHDHDHEDVPESFVAWMHVRQNPDSPQSLRIRAAIPNRLAAMDDLVWSRYPTQ